MCISFAKRNGADAVPIDEGIVQCKGISMGGEREREGAKRTRKRGGETRKQRFLLYL